MLTFYAYKSRTASSLPKDIHGLGLLLMNRLFSPPFGIPCVLLFQTFLHHAAHTFSSLLPLLITAISLSQKKGSSSSAEQETGHTLLPASANHPGLSLQSRETELQQDISIPSIFSMVLFYEAICLN